MILPSPTVSPAGSQSTRLGAILNPTGVAVIGASDTPAKAGGRVVYNLINSGFEGHIVPVNPARATVLGLECFPSIGQAPGPVPELAFIALPNEKLPGALAECAEAGVRCCVANAVGFAEIDEVGARREDELREIVRRTGIRVIGPNCLGLMTARCQLNLTSGWTVSEPPAIGSIGVISQSGSMMVYLYHRAADLGSGISSGISIGNQADLELSDFIEEMAQDSATQVICAYVEGVKDGQRFLRAADMCRAAGKPLLVVKAGRTATGASITRSHTASMTTPADVFNAVCRDHGVILADDPDTMIAMAVVIERGSVPRPGGVAVFSGSGGGLATAIDRVAEAGLVVPALTPDSWNRLNENVLMPSGLAAVDIGRRRGGGRNAPVGEIASVLARDPAVAAVIFCVTVMPYLTERTLEAGEAIRSAGKQFLPTLLPGSAARELRTALLEAGFPCFEHLDDAIRFAQVWTTQPGQESSGPSGGRPSALTPPATLADLPAGPLTEAEAKEALSRYGVSVNRGQLAASADEAVIIAESLGYPVVVKVASRSVVHKSDAGGVKLGLQDAVAVRTACKEIAASIDSAEAAPAFLVQEMIGQGTELIAGVTRDEQFGAVVTVGFGGVFAELVKDIAVAPAPITPARALAMLQGLRIWPLLAGARGSLPGDAEAVAAAIAGLSWLGADLGERLIEFEINPLIALESGAVAVDARASLS
jgi:acyl-CoA synthetase (NDP forming)